MTDQTRAEALDRATRCGFTLNAGGEGCYDGYPHRHEMATGDVLQWTWEGGPDSGQEAAMQQWRDEAQARKQEEQAE